MAELKDDLKKALEELRKEKERKFDQTADLIINLQKFDLKKDGLNTVITIPHVAKEKKVCAFLEAKNANVDTILKEEFGKYKDKKKLKNLVDKYDFFMAQASVMPAVATTFGRALGPAGKMPSPQLGLLINVDDKTIKELKKKVNSSIKVRSKEASIKLSVGKFSMKDKDIVDNAMAIYNAIEKQLPRNKENIKNVEIKFTMTKPVKIHIR